MTKRQESIELLNATHDFPCSFTFKVIGSSSDGFVHRVLSTVIRIVGDGNQGLESPPHEVKQTPQGRHMSITVEPHVNTAEQVLLVYEELRSLDGVVMLL